MANLLVVDDDKDVAEPLIMFLEIMGHQVRYSEDGLAALRSIRESFPELILLDVEMPRLTGPEMACRLLIEDCGREMIPILLLSGVSGLSEVARKIGTPYFLSKPYSIDELEVMLNRALIERISPTPSK